VGLFARDGVHQWFDRSALEPGGCSAEKIVGPTHSFIDNTLAALDASKRLAARMVEVPVVETADGKFVAFGDSTLECRTDGKGPVREKTLTQLKALDAGHGYTADGKTFPFRGKERGQIPTLEEFVRGAGEKPLLFRLTSEDPAAADRFAAALKQTNRNVKERKDGFFASPAATARLKDLFPGVWAFSEEDARACTEAYIVSGWFAITPEACRHSTLVIPLNQQWAFAGWPNRLIGRMDAAGARILVIAREDEHGRAIGLDLPEQLREVPATFDGLLLIDDLWTIGPTLNPSLDRRRLEEEELLQRELERRRKARL
jgi:glycerophosphoryl diester phosphodiesterase